MALQAGSRTSMQKQETTARRFQVETHSRVEFKDVTDLLQRAVAESGVENGVCHVFVPHTSAAVLIQENADPALQKDLEDFLRRLAPCDASYKHDDGNCDAHLKSAVIGCSKTLIVENGGLLLGRWQGVFFCEFDGPRRRDLHLKVVAG